MAFALTKGEHPEWAVQKLTEAGADRVVIMVTDRCVARWAPNNGGRQLDRLREIARQAAMQSRRCWLPLVEGPVPFSALVGGDDGRPGNGEVALAEQGGGPLTLATPTVLVGPEGGWSDEELAAVPEGRRVALGATSCERRRRRWRPASCWGRCGPVWSGRPDLRRPHPRRQWRRRRCKRRRRRHGTPSRAPAARFWVRSTESVAVQRRFGLVARPIAHGAPKKELTEPFRPPRRIHGHATRIHGHGTRLVAAGFRRDHRGWMAPPR